MREGYRVMLVPLAAESIIFLMVGTPYSLDLNTEFMALNADFAPVTDEVNSVF